jgi:hypothetical protein
MIYGDYNGKNADTNAKKLPQAEAFKFARVSGKNKRWLRRKPNYAN